MLQQLLGIPARLATSKVSVILIVIFLAVQGYLLIRPRTAPLDPVRAHAADRIAEQVVEALGEFAGKGWSGRYVNVAPFFQDQGDQIRSRIESALRSRTNCRLVTDTILAQIREEALNKASRLGIVKQVSADGWKAQPLSTLSQALALAEKAGVDFVVYGSIDDFRSLHDKVFLKMTVRVVDAENRVATFEQQFIEGSEAVFADIPSSAFVVENRRFGARMMTWVLFVLLLPLITASFWRILLQQESNVLNICCLLFLSSLDVLLAWGLMGFWLHTIWYKISLLIGFLASTTWNLFILNLVERNRLQTKFQDKPLSQ